MHSNTEGNSPSLRAQLGVGWNRALPNPFTFGNGIQPDGVNDKISVRGMHGLLYNNLKVFSVEFWIKNAFTANENILSMQFADGSQIYIEYILSGGNLFRIIFQNGVFTINNTINAGGGAGHYVMTIDLSPAVLIAKLYLNGILIKTNSLTNQTSATSANHALSFIDLFFRTSTPLAKKVDAFRFYNRIVSLEEVILNYNGGVGNNPSKTEGLRFWYDFNEAESDTILYPGGLPSGWTSGNWGVRDKTQNGNHGECINFAANNATLGGAIQAY